VRVSRESKIVSPVRSGSTFLREYDRWKNESSEDEMTVSYKGHSRAPHHEVRALSWSPRGSHIASAAVLDHRLHVWNTRTGSRDRIYNLPAEVSAVAWSPDGTIMTGDESGMITLWHNPQSRVIDVLRLQRAEPARYAMHQTSEEFQWIDSSLLGRRKVWESRSVDTIAPAPKGNLVFSTSGSFHVSTSVGTWRIWDMTSRAEHCVSRNLSSLTATWSPDGTRLACAEGLDFTVRAAPSGAELLRLGVRNDGGKTDMHHCAIAWSPDGTMLATNNGILQVWDTVNWQPIASCDDRRHVTGVSWSPDSTRLAVASDPPQATLRIVHARAGKVIAEPAMAAAGDFIGPAAWAPLDDRIAYSDNKGAIHVIAAP
jgi:WD40 repeat protein